MPRRPWTVSAVRAERSLAQPWPKGSGFLQGKCALRQPHPRPRSSQPTKTLKANLILPLLLHLSDFTMDRSAEKGCQTLVALCVVHVCVCMHACMCALGVHVCVQVCVRACMCAYVHRGMRACTCTCVCRVCTCVGCMHAHVCVHVHWDAHVCRRVCWGCMCMCAHTPTAVGREEPSVSSAIAQPRPRTRVFQGRLHLRPSP